MHPRRTNASTMIRKSSRNFHPFLIAFFLLITPVSAWAAPAGWDITAEIKRLAAEVPALAAFEGAEGIVWHSDYSYDLMADGTTRKRHRSLVLLGREGEPPKMTSHIVPFPDAEGSNVTIDKAAWFDPRTGLEISPLSVKYFDENGLRYYRTEIPTEARGNVLAFDYTTTNPMRYFLDDVLPLAGELPVWERFINVEIPSGMDFYWEGTGVRSPERQKIEGAEKIKWTILNQHVWKHDGIILERRPTLLFSLQRGLITHLKNLSTKVYSFKAPAMPSSVASSKGNLQKAFKTIQDYMASKNLVIDDSLQKIVRNNIYITPEGPWTKSEQTLIAGKWLEALGWNVRVFWTQKIPVGVSGPGSSSLWDEPLLIIAQESGKSDAYFKSDPNLVFGKLPSGLYGVAVYRFGESDIERLVLPKGTASEHSLSQMWKIDLDESGIATGTLDLTVTGGWVDIMGMGRTPSLDDASSLITQKILFPIPGSEFKAKSIKPLSNGYRLTLDVKARAGIVSGTDILLRMPGGMPLCFAEIPASAEGFSFRFPFVMEQNAVITTPKGYQAFMLPGKMESGDSKAAVESSIVHWPKRRRAEANFKWTVRSSIVDEFASSRIIDQAKTAFAWSHTNIPLRK